MAKISNLSNTKLNVLRYLSYWLYVLCTIGVPIGLVSWQFEIFKKPSETQLTTYGIILVIMLVFICRGHIKRAIAEMETCTTKTIIINLGRLLPWMACWFIISFISEASTASEKVEFIMFWSIIGNILAMFLDIWHTALYKESKRRE